MIEPGVDASVQKACKVLRRTVMVLVTFCLISGTDGLASTVVAARTSRGIAIAADSRVTILRNGGTSQVNDGYCKVGHTEDVIYSIAGIYKEQGSTVSAFTLAEHAMSRPGSFDTRMQGYDAEVTAWLKTVMTSLSRRDPAEFGAHVNHVLLETVFGTFADTVPILMIHTYRLEDTGGVISVRSLSTRCPGHCAADRAIFIVGLGEYGAIDRYLRAPLNLVTRRGLPQALEALVNREIQAQPDTVGPPVSTILWDRSGIHWYDGHSGLCQKDQDDRTLASPRDQK